MPYLSQRKNVTVRLEADERQKLTDALPRFHEWNDIGHWRTHQRSLSYFIRFAALKMARELEQGARSTEAVESALRLAGETQGADVPASERPARDLKPQGVPRKSLERRAKCRPTKRKATQRPLKLGRTRKGKPAKGRLWSKVDRLAKKKRARR